MNVCLGFFAYSNLLGQISAQLSWITNQYLPISPQVTWQLQLILQSYMILNDNERESCNISRYNSLTYQFFRYRRTPPLKMEYSTWQEVRHFYEGDSRHTETQISSSCRDSNNLRTNHQDTVSSMTLSSSPATIHNNVKVVIHTAIIYSHSYTCFYT